MRVGRWAVPRPRRWIDHSAIPSDQDRAGHLTQQLTVQVVKRAMRTSLVPPVPLRPTPKVFTAPPAGHGFAA